MNARKGILDVSVNSILDVTPRKVGKATFGLAKRLYKAASGSEVRQLRKELEALKAKL